MAKKTSKRISERKKTRTAVKNARKEAKLKREMRKKQRNAPKIPKNYLATDEEKELAKSIQKATKERTRSAESPQEEPGHISELKRCMSLCDAFIEVVDFRDIAGSRCEDCEELLKQGSKKFFVYLNHTNDSFQVDMASLQGEMCCFLSDPAMLSACNKICIFGNRKTGKFLLSKAIEEANPGAEFEFVRVPVKLSGASDLFRGYVDLNNINPSVMFENCWKNIDQSVIRDFYMLRNFDSVGSFLDLFAEKISRETSRKRTHDDAAICFFKDVLNGKIRWLKRDEDLYFSFVNAE